MYPADWPQAQQRARQPQQPAADVKQYDRSLNSVASQLQLLDYAGSKSLGKSTEQQGPGEQEHGEPWRPEPKEAVSVTYKLAGATSMPSRNEQQMIQIDSLAMKADFFKEAVPVLTDHAYDQARLLNTSDMVLLAGPVSSYVNGQFVGHGRIPTVAAGEHFTVGFGVDSSIRAARQLVDKHVEVQGGNRVINFTYRLTLMNFADKPAEVRLLDRLPTTNNDSKIRVTLSDPGQPLSKDADYVHKDKDKGILRWDVTVPAHATGTTAFTLTYQFRMEYDRQREITGMSDGQ